jgi:ATP-dependent DNA ligase
MFKPLDFCIPTKATAVPDGEDWLHEIKYDGYRLGLERDGDRVRLITKGGYNWSDRYPRIVEAARKVRQRRFVLDGEAVVLGVDGISDFNVLHSGNAREHRAAGLPEPEWPQAIELWAARAEASRTGPAIAVPGF